MSRRPIFRRTGRKGTRVIPARSGAPDNGIDSVNLQKSLSAFGVDHEAHRTDILDLLKDTRKQALDQAFQMFTEGRYGGIETARLIASIYDELISALFHFTTHFVISRDESDDKGSMSVCGVGGYGRGEMAPFSDLDLLFLVPDKQNEAIAQQVTEYMLYMLWDMGLKVGQSIRTVDQNIQMAKSDQTILTALLDLRHICGSQDLSENLFSRFRRDITRGKGRKYIAAKLEERDNRHNREGNSRYVIEPNIKEGKGGLRDLHILYWIARFLDNDGKITDAQKPSIYVDMGLFDAQAADRFERAADFLWRARIHLHLNAGRAVETLSFDHQTVLARKMGHASGPVEEAVERFMREYFLNARDVGALTRIACAKLEAEKSIRLPKGLDAWLPNSRRNMKEPEFVLDHGRLMFKNPLDIKQSPSLILHLFEIAGRRNLDIHPDAISAIDFRRNLIDNHFRTDPENAEIFKKILLNSKAPYATLKIMNETGVLGRYLQEFGGIVARTQFNMHHAYTVDEHTLRLVDFFNNIEYGYDEDSQPELTEIVRNFSEEQRLALYLACLLHDTGKGKGDQCIEGAQLARKALRRMQMSLEMKDAVSWLVRRHLDMSETAQRRDISDPETIADFGTMVGSLSRLQMLYVLTVVDIRSVGPGVWNDWKGSLLKELYRSTAAFLEGKEDLEPAAKAAAARQHLEEQLPEGMYEKIHGITEALGDSYWLGFTMTSLVRQARFFNTVIQADKPYGVHTRVNRKKDITELWVLTRDRRGLFADLAGTIAMCGAQIVGARLHTGPTGQVMDVFYLQNADGMAYGRLNPDITDNLRHRIISILENPGQSLRLPKPRLTRRAKAIPIKPDVRIIEKGVRNTQTIIEIEGRDRPGLLFALGDTLLKENISVASAHIEVVGNRAIDAFYVSGVDGRLGEDQKTRIKEKFLKILDLPDQVEAA